MSLMTQHPAPLRLTGLDPDRSYRLTDETATTDYLTITKATGALSGAHIQSLGTSDSPTFSGLSA